MMFKDSRLRMMPKIISVMLAKKDLMGGSKAYLVQIASDRTSP